MIFLSAFDEALAFSGVKATAVASPAVAVTPNRKK
jgi:hypothetical protein